ncbi:MULTISPECIES: acetoacetyl-CoA reductase [Cycloclasticus]|jgi:acetoacetyl-CoA reductase|uniref:Acetoacetyl-CoA reductase pro n=1 Tax=Cycloclasticus pugetii TaxID=34068 RepID=A0AB33Z4B0_9GAMM|nr:MULTISPECIES: acetoacetyl-CoA reductase [Cycloclasticus]ATI03831.1 acetoacetyl-CoA reductase [Cycloclasticus sp. PY97N]EPD14264.1 acetoacetyl-CoA reductase pro [Cycloclasticus pugetii]PHR51821.1 MAG: beta-ketoacyl-ACP reductase [Cycloclasticus sp.]SHI94211.1 3-oxoacyl-[acyl-carrier-protein] reductase [Cycloclasticus pugetii]|tara:strand:+ start:3710 stop:4447 length:738 start_codon:yes stop_codon:yes gene_type:complete
MSQRVALVTGGTGGIGEAVCQRFVKDGYKVVAAYNNREKAQAWQLAQKEAGFDIEIVHCPVTDFEACGDAIQWVENNVGPIDILVNNAGITKDGMFKKMPRENWDAVIDTDLNSVFNMTRQVFEGMVERGFGRIINVSSVNGQLGQIGQVNYSAAKAGVHGFTKALARETARKGVTVNTISPGYVATPMVMAIDDEVRKMIESNIPTGRLCQPEEVAHGVSFLASDLAAYTTGSDLSMNGGLFMH